MRLPIKADLVRQAASGPGIWLCSGDYKLNPNRRAYKYYWQVFTLDTAWEGQEFFANAPSLCIAEFMALEERLRRERKSAYVYNRKCLRESHGLPLDMNHPRWRGVRLVVSLENDPDPEYDGWK
ncbi:hypothetical protein [Caballeronia sp. Lep1P3]|uniref:hypothetical protein n=1 Tax=Caballeronia sp. Lep1P3 TaxID=2878150 RepID=UPI001FD5E34D|nr:hypothetical protein [Caballeronia sp. Lep1P3]